MSTINLHFRNLRNCYWSTSRLSFSRRSFSNGSDNLLKLNYINGKLCHVADQAKDGDIVIREPSSNNVIGNLSSSGPKTVDDGVRSAATAFPEWSTQTAIDRGRALIRVSRLLKERSEEFVTMEVRDTGKPIQEARCDVESAINCFEYYGGIAATLSGNNIPYKH